MNYEYVFIQKILNYVYRFKFLGFGRGLSFINVICSIVGSIPTFNVTDLEQVTPDVPHTSFCTKIDMIYNSEV